MNPSPEIGSSQKVWILFLLSKSINHKSSVSKQSIVIGVVANLCIVDVELAVVPTL